MRPSHLFLETTQMLTPMRRRGGIKKGWELLVVFYFQFRYDLSRYLLKHGELLITVRIG